MRNIEVFKTCELNSEICDTSFDNFLGQMQEVRLSIPEEYRNTAHIEISSYEDYGSSYATISISYCRPYTAEELAEQEAQHMAILTQVRERELKTLTELQAKYNLRDKT